MKQVISTGETVLEIIRHDYCKTCAELLPQLETLLKQPSAPEVSTCLFARIDDLSDEIVNISVKKENQAAAPIEVWHVRRELIPRPIQVVGKQFTICGTAEDLTFLRESSA